MPKKATTALATVGPAQERPLRLLKRARRTAYPAQSQALCFSASSLRQNFLMLVSGLRDRQGPPLSLSREPFASSLLHGGVGSAHRAS